jgi:flavin prenyltransferase
LARSEAPRLVVGVSGASGALLAVRLLCALRELGVESHLVASRAAALTLTQETSLTLADLAGMASVAYRPGQIGAAIASGSFPTLGMIVAPCSVKTMSEIATGVTSSLLTRAADVTLKERRRLVLLFRETPLHAGHLRAMTHATENGAIVMPPVPALYARPDSIDAMVTQTISRALDLFGIESGLTRRWTGERMSPHAA